MNNRGQLSYVWMMIALGLTVVFISYLWIILSNTTAQMLPQMQRISTNQANLTTVDTMFKFSVVAVLGGAFLYMLAAGQNRGGV